MFLLLAILPTNITLLAQETSGARIAISTWAGSETAGSADGTGSVARFDYPYAVAADAAGNVFVADSNSQTIRKISPAGVVTTLAGSAGGFGSSDGTRESARFSSPQGVAVDLAGNLYVADTNNQIIRKISPAGAVITLAGTAEISGSADGSGGAAQFDLPSGVAVDHAGNVYVADSNNQTIRKISPAGTVTTIAGAAGVHGSADGPGGAARFSGPQGVAVDGAGNLYVADTNNQTIRKISSNGQVTTLAGAAGIVGSSDGAGSAARFNYPFNLAVDSSGNVYVADVWNNTLRRITAAGLVTTIAGAAGISGAQDGPGGVALFSGPRAVAVDGTGAIFIADTGNNTIRKGVFETAGFPIVTTHPVGRTVTMGRSVTLSASASGTPALTFQWQKEGVAIAGATGETYTIANVTPGHAGSYTFVAANGVGSVISNAAALAVGSPPAGFDASAYLARYPYVAALQDTDPFAAWVYYRDHGIYLGEVYDELFRVEEYLSLYPDLFAVFGNDLSGALQHWLTEGRIEGKLGRVPLEFSASGYFSRNPDVAAAVGGNALLAWQHYWLYGIYEGRAYDDELRVFEYLSINADLTAALVGDWRQAALHWMRYGRTEGRLGRIPLTFDVAEYLRRSPEIAATWGTDPTTVFLHFWLYGINEGRTYDNLFRVDDYLALNPDLAAVFGADRRGAFKHWVRYGQNEGRPGRNL